MRNAGDDAGELNLCGSNDLDRYSGLRIQKCIVGIRELRFLSGSLIVMDDIVLSRTVDRAVGTLQRRQLIISGFGGEKLLDRSLHL